jgi:hypothetical protein
LIADIAIAVPLSGGKQQWASISFARYDFRLYTASEPHPALTEVSAALDRFRNSPCTSVSE